MSAIGGGWSLLKAGLQHEVSFSTNSVLRWDGRGCSGQWMGGGGGVVVECGREFNVKLVLFHDHRDGVMAAECSGQ